MGNSLIPEKPFSDVGQIMACGKPVDGIIAVAKSSD